MNARNRVFVILGLLTVGSLVWYLWTSRTSPDLKLIGTVDANEVMVSSKLQGRIEKLAVDEGQAVKAGQLIAVIESEDLSAAHRAAQASAESQRGKLAETVETLHQTEGEVSSAERNAEATLQVARANEAQARAELEHQAADTRRTVALAGQGIASEQQKDDAVTSEAAAKAAQDAAKEQVGAAEAALRQAHAHTLQAAAVKQTVASTQGLVANAKALADEAQAELGYAQIFSPVTGIVNVRAAREGEVVTPGQAIVTVMDLTETWVYAPLTETQGDAVKLGDMLRVDLPSGQSVQGKVIAKAAEADFATQRDINGGRKRDIRTVQLKLLIPNDGERFVPGMTAEVYIPKAKLVKQ